MPKMRPERVERIENAREVLSGVPIGERGAQAWFLDQVVRIQDWAPGKATIHRYFRGGEDLSVEAIRVFDTTLVVLEEEARQLLRERLRSFD